MDTTSENLKKVLTNQPIKNLEKLKRQQEYYKRLTESGTARKQSYSLKPLSAI